MYHETFDYDEVWQALMDSVWEDRPEVTLKFGSDEAYNTAVFELFTNGMLKEPSSYLMQKYNVSKWSYSYRQDPVFRLITIYWKKQ